MGTERGGAGNTMPTGKPTPSADGRNRLPTKSEVAAARLVQITHARLGRPIPDWIDRVAAGLTPQP